MRKIKLKRNHYPCGLGNRTVALVVFLALFGLNTVSAQGVSQTKTKLKVGQAFKDGLAPVQINGKYGFLNMKGEHVIACKYDFTSEFNICHSKNR